MVLTDRGSIPRLSAKLKELVIQLTWINNPNNGGEAMATVMWDNDGVMSGWFPQFYPWICEKESWTPLAGWSEAEGYKGVYWHFYRSHGMEDAAFVARLTEYAEAGGFADQVIYPGVRDAVIQIKTAGHSQHIVTDRPAIAEADTAWWIETYCPEIDTLTVSRDKTVFKNYGDGPYFAIDDRHENVETMRKAGISAFLLSRPWNDHSDQPRIESVQEFADLVCLLGKNSKVVTDE